MSKHDEAMKEHIANIVFIEKRPFSYKDFSHFKVDGKDYKISHGTFRNKISKMIQNDEVVAVINSNPKFYTLKDSILNSKNIMTHDHREVINTNKIVKHPIHKILYQTPFDERAVHDLHLTFKAEGIYDALLNNPELKKEINQYNKDKFNYYDIDKFSIIISVYPTNTCKIVIGCSENPILLNFKGINLLATTLCRIEERLSKVMF